MEDYSRDSFENLLFGICCFKEHAGKYPSQVTLVSWAFKEKRLDLHRAAIGLSKSEFTFEGTGNPTDLSAAWAGEQAAVAEFERDPLGVGPVLSGKRGSAIHLDDGTISRTVVRSLPDSWLQSVQ